MIHSVKHYCKLRNSTLNEKIAESWDVNFYIVAFLELIRRPGTVHGYGTETAEFEGECSLGRRWDVCEGTTQRVAFFFFFASNFPRASREPDSPTCRGRNHQQAENQNEPPVYRTDPLDARGVRPVNANCQKRTMKCTE
eukprot:COSAG02_NODE_4202_length_5629_cov_19.844123_2_plen_139_part_00